MSKLRGRPFEPGNTLGRGRPKGSRNRAKSPGQDLFDEFAPHITRKCIAQALQGEPSAMRICMNRISPARLGECIRIGLPPIKTAGDLHKAGEKVTQTVGRGEITPTEGGKMMNILAGRAKIIETVQLDGRLAKIEERMDPDGMPLAA
jgi:hypothetical protein